jgi:hypothetical protein
VQDERGASGGGGAGGVEVSAKRGRMRPTKCPKHQDREVNAMKLGPLRIVMADGCNSAEQVSYSAPEQPHGARHVIMLCDNIVQSCVYVLPPLDVILIRRIGEVRKEGVLQMIVGVDEAGHEEETAEVDVRAA